MNEKNLFPLKEKLQELSKENIKFRKDTQKELEEKLKYDATEFYICEVQPELELAAKNGYFTTVINVNDDKLLAGLLLLLDEDQLKHTTTRFDNHIYSVEIRWD